MKKLISTLVAMVMVTLSLTVPAVQAVEYGKEYQNKPTANYSQVFHDVPTSYWAFSYIGEMNVRGVLSGYPNGYFYPENYVTRAEFAKIMTVASGLPLNKYGENVYADVSLNDWYYPYVLTAQYYLCGYNMNGGIYYLPDTNALREDIAVALVKLKGYDTTGYDESILKAMFTDYQSISDDAKPYVATALEKGLISGYEDNTFRGQDSITRAEAATLLWRAYQYGSGNKVTASAEPYIPETPKPTAAPTIAPTENTDNNELYFITFTPENMTVNVGDKATVRIDVVDGKGIDFDQLVGYYDNEDTAGFIKEEVGGTYEDIRNNNIASLIGAVGIDEDKITYVYKYYVIYELDTSKKLSNGITYSYRDKTAHFNFTVNDSNNTSANVTQTSTPKPTKEPTPEPKYTWEVDTLLPNVGNVEKMDYYKDGVMYISGDEVIAVNSDGDKEVLFNCDDMAEQVIEENADELSKLEKKEFSVRLIDAAVNHYTDDVYVLCSDDINGKYLYNIDTREKYKMRDGDHIYDFFENGDCIIDNGEFDGIRRDIYYIYIVQLGHDDSNMSRITYNENRRGRVNGKRDLTNGGGEGGCYVINDEVYDGLSKYDWSTMTFNDIDVDNKGSYIAHTKNYIYTKENGNFYKMNTDGDSELILSSKDLIAVRDRTSFDISKVCEPDYDGYIYYIKYAINDNSEIIFYDEASNAIRILKEID